MLPRVALAAILLLGNAASVPAQNRNDWNRDGGRDNSGAHRDDWRDDNWHNDDRRENDQYQDRRDRNDDVTEVQKNACKPDVFRLCSWYIPSREKITACLHQNIAKLNPDCRAVMEGRLR